MMKVTQLFLLFLFLVHSSLSFATNEIDLSVELMQLKQTAKAFNVLKKHPNKVDRARKYEGVILSRADHIIRDYNSLDHRSKQAQRAQVFKQLKEVSQSTGLRLFTINKEGGIRSIPKEMQESKLKPKQLEMSASLKRRKKAVDVAKNFAGQLFAFTAAGGILAAFHSNSLDNPVAMQQSYEAAVDPYGIASFGAFIWGHHKVSGVLSRSKYIPKSLANFAGMGAGMVLSSTLHELMVDTDIRECHFGVELTPVEKLLLGEYERKAQKKLKQEEACIRASERWFTTGKYAALTPEVFSLGGGALGAYVTMTGLGKASVKIFPKFVESVKAAMYKQSVEGAAVTMTPQGRVIRMGIVIGNFVVFMWFHEQSSPWVYKVWNPLNFKYLGLSLTEELRKDKAEHSNGVRSFNENKVDYNWLHNNVDQLKSYREEKFKECLKVSDRFHRDKDQKHQNPIFDGCMRKKFPNLIIQNNYAFNKARNELILKSFKEKQQNWYTLLGNFSHSFGAAESFYKRIKEIKLQTMNMNRKEMFEFELEQFDKLFEGSSLKDSSLRAMVGDLPRDSYPKSKNKVKFRHFSEFLIYSMACGVEPGERVLRSDENDYHNLAGVGFVKTPFGSSFEFLPPRVAKYDKSICRRVSMNQAQQTDKEVGMVYNWDWVDEEGKKYKNLMEYVFANLEQDFLNYEESEEVNFKWWEDTVSAAVQEVWSEYDQAYIRLVRNELLPKLMPFVYREESDLYKKVKSKLSEEQVDALEQRNEKKDKETLESMEKAAAHKTVIGLTYKNIYTDYELIIKLLKSKGLLSKTIQENLDQALKLLHEEMRFHKNKLQNWNNNLDLYSSEKGQSVQESIEASKQIKALLKGVQDELVPGWLILTKTYTVDDIIAAYNCNVREDQGALEGQIAERCKLRLKIDEKAAELGPILASLEVIDKQVNDYFLLVTDLTQILSF